MAQADIEGLRQEIAALLPAAMLRAMDSYRRFALGDEPEAGDAKAFAQHHAACRAALVHLDALVKLTRWANAGARDAAAAAADEAELARLLAEARAALRADPDHPDDEEP